MKIIEKKQDLFSGTEDYYYAHCISADFALGAGIAVQFNKRYNMSKCLKETYQTGYVASSLKIGNVFNLVAKEKYWQKPTYESLYDALTDMSFQIQENHVTKLAMPKIGCGLDRLK